MDKLNHITFSLQQGDNNNTPDDQSYLISFQQEDHTPNLHVPVVDAGMGNTGINISESSTRKKPTNRRSSKPNFDGEDDKTQKKMVHREIEKERRQGMSKLYASLRDLLPLEFVKGNRSISDHIHQAVDYIKQVEENVKGLSMKRDQLKNISGTNASYVSNNVSVNLSEGGVKIVINSCSIEDGFSLSAVLKTLLEEGLNVTSCILTKVNDRFIHSIQSEANDIALIDPSMLQQRLVFAANNQIN
ncbi:transcription factor bHLH118-like [Rutidosis leptorrhynchoides]|uniref:transcription factor bHLH118-like n=1 Tax=Rutidosis leptorrhynchoides TaxID=125765 RepID=UPI003A9A38E8